MAGHRPPLLVMAGQPQVQVQVWLRLAGYDGLWPTMAGHGTGQRRVQVQVWQMRAHGNLSIRTLPCSSEQH